MPGNDIQKNSGNEAGREFWRHFVFPAIGVIVLAAFVGLLPLWVLPGEKLKERLQMLGTFGDMFGMLNTALNETASR
jgi:hypothetical protein